MALKQFKGKIFRSLACAGLAALVSLASIGCRKHPTYSGYEEAIRAIQEQTASTRELTDKIKRVVEKTELPEGYKIVSYFPRDIAGTYLRFEHDNVHKSDKLYLRTSLRFVDENCDGSVDEIAGASDDTASSYYLHQRREPGTEEMFQIADKELKEAKAEIGVQ